MNASRKNYSILSSLRNRFCRYFRLELFQEKFQDRVDSGEVCSEGCTLFHRMVAVREVSPHDVCYYCYQHADNDGFLPLCEELWQLSFLRKGTMVKFRQGIRSLEPAAYRIRIQGILDKNWSDYYGGMKIEHEGVSKHHAMTILMRTMADQSALIGVLNSLFDIGYPILSVEYLETGQSDSYQLDRTT